MDIGQVLQTAIWFFIMIKIFIQHWILEKELFMEGKYNMYLECKGKSK